ncbi:Peptidase_C39 like family protein [Tissierella praeacuta DSM 18095]|uniref:Peptidase_C39 like family protein n=2 Tax=Tissierella praeacuta TaxID=43131 RepID=A0A1M4YM14_9FIRM|nr:C39 family peptidase [Tissierella praeacuta]SHF06844.1 Peptidase_C39 like family protein [Tissierella praeacuta DSM 18095]SUP02328.1 Uncharacterised protein [Tissierella praeacuta]
MKKILMFLLSLVLVVGMSTSVFATDNVSARIKSLDTKHEITEYAIEVLPKHLNALIGVGDLSGNVDEYSIGNSFTLFNVEQKTNSICFPVLQRGNIVAILEVVENQGEYNSSLSISFSRELNDLFEQRELNDFVLLTDGINLQAFNGERTIDVFKLYDDGVEVGELYYNFDLLISSLSNYLNQDDLRTDLKLTEARDLNLRTRAIDGPTSYRTLNVNGVSQSGNTCWAATCAAIINYYKGYSLSDIDVARYIFDDNWNQGGSWTNMKDAYNHWGLYPSQTGVISFTSVKNNINGGNPMHIRLTSGGSGHSVGLIGYEDWVGSPGGSNERILILLEPNGGVHRSVTLNSSGNFNYNLGGGAYSWSKTIEF